MSADIPELPPEGIDVNNDEQKEAFFARMAVEPKGGRFIVFRINLDNKEEQAFAIFGDDLTPEDVATALRNIVETGASYLQTKYGDPPKEKEDE